MNSLQINVGQAPAIHFPIYTNLPKTFHKTIYNDFFHLWTKNI